MTSCLESLAFEFTYSPEPIMFTNTLTDPGRWRLDVDEGVHRWRYLDELASARRPQSAAEKYFLGLPTVRNVSRSSYNVLFAHLSRDYHNFLPRIIFSNLLAMDSDFTRVSSFMMAIGAVHMAAPASCLLA